MIRYNLTLDALRAKARASFLDLDDKSDRRISRTITVEDQLKMCAKEKFVMSVSRAQEMEEEKKKARHMIAIHNQGNETDDKDTTQGTKYTQTDETTRHTRIKHEWSEGADL